MQFEKPLTESESDEENMETEGEERSKGWHNPDANNYGESWWANALDEEKERSPNQEARQNTTRQKPTVEYHHMSENEEGQPEEELSDCRSSSEGSARQRLASHEKHGNVNVTAIGGLQAAIEALAKKGTTEAGENDAKVRRVGD